MFNEVSNYGLSFHNAVAVWYRLVPFFVLRRLA